MIATLGIALTGQFFWPVTLTADLNEEDMNIINNSEVMMIDIPELMH